MKKYSLDISEYKPDWPYLYKKEKARLEKVVTWTGIIFEHIGGTSVPGLAGKPIIDIAIGLEDFSIADQLVEKIQNLGYHYEADLMSIYPEFKFLWKGEKFNGAFDKHQFHVSIQSIESNSWKNTLLFRDYLRNHPEAAANYGEMKKKLSARYVTDNKKYTLDKTSFIQSILQKAEINPL